MAYKERILMFLSIVVALAMLATACGGDDESGGADEESGPGEPTIDGEFEEDNSCGPYPVLFASLRSLLLSDESFSSADIPFKLVWTPSEDSDGTPHVYSVELPPGSIPADSGIGGLNSELPTLRQHFFGPSPIDRGHPVDLPDDSPSDTDPRAYVTDVAGAGGGTVAIIDVDSGSGHPYGEHGAFIASLLDEIGASTVPIGLQPIPLALSPDGLFFDEADVLEALSSTRSIAELDAINLSLGTYACDEHEPGGFQAVLTDLTAPIVASAGNGGTDQKVYPAAFPEVISVGSVGTDEAQSCFSNHGSWVDHWMVGEEVVARDSTGKEITWSGTSFAAPQIAGQIETGIGIEFPTPTRTGADPSRDWGCPLIP